MGDNRRYVNLETKVLEGDSPPFIVEVAGWRYLFEIHDPTDASFSLTEIAPSGMGHVLTYGSEQ